MRSTTFAVSAHLRHRAHHAAPVSERVRREFRGLHVQFSLSFPHRPAVVALQSSSARRSEPRWIGSPSAANGSFTRSMRVFPSPTSMCPGHLRQKRMLRRAAYALTPRTASTVEPSAHAGITGVLTSNLRSQLFRRSRNSDLSNSRIKP